MFMCVYDKPCCFVCVILFFAYFFHYIVKKVCSCPSPRAAPVRSRHNTSFTVFLAQDKGCQGKLHLRLYLHVAPLRHKDMITTLMVKKELDQEFLILIAFLDGSTGRLPEVNFIL